MRQGYTSTTSNLCRWNQIFKDKVYSHIVIILTLWNLQKNIYFFQHEPARIIEIDFSKPKHSRESTPTSSSPPIPKRKKVIPPPTSEEQQRFLKRLQTFYPESVILTATLLQGVPACAHVTHLPATIPSLFDPKYKELSSAQLQEECKHVFRDEIKVTKEESKYLAESTRLQSRSLVWHEHRMGQITASQFGVICHTNSDSPSKSLVSSILCRQQLSAPALRWGLDNEDNAKGAYCKAIKDDHDDFVVHSTGLHVNPLYPHLGASPDGLVSCSCCGEGLLGLKCPYSICDEDPTRVQKINFYLKPCAGSLKLVRSHNYYYQVQGQLLVCNLRYCDFVCWTPKGVHIKRIERDDDFCQDMQVKLSAFFVKVILPYILTGTTTSQGKENEPPQLQEHNSQFATAAKENLERWWLVIILFVV